MNSARKNNMRSLLWRQEVTTLLYIHMVYTFCLLNLAVGCRSYFNVAFTVYS